MPLKLQQDTSEQYPLSYFKLFDNSNEVYIDGNLFLRYRSTKKTANDNHDGKATSLQADFF